MIKSSSFPREIDIFSHYNNQKCGIAFNLDTLELTTGTLLRYSQEQQSIIAACLHQLSIVTFEIIAIFFV